MLILKSPCRALPVMSKRQRYNVKWLVEQIPSVLRKRLSLFLIKKIYDNPVWADPRVILEEILSVKSRPMQAPRGSVTNVAIICSHRGDRRENTHNRLKRTSPVTLWLKRAMWRDLKAIRSGLLPSLKSFFCDTARSFPTARSWCWLPGWHGSSTLVDTLLLTVHETADTTLG